MSMDKLKQAMQLIQECMEEYQGEETDESDSSGDSYSDNSGSPSMGVNDKIKMAASLMKRKN